MALSLEERFSVAARTFGWTLFGTLDAALEKVK
jgi:hypothetical protein